MLPKIIIFFLSWTFYTVQAHPKSCLDISQPLRSLLKNNPIGHKFCLDLLKYFWKTTVTTTKTKTLPAATKTKSVTSTLILTDFTTTSTTVTLTDTVTETSTLTTTSYIHDLVKRGESGYGGYGGYGDGGPKIPPFLKKYSISDLIDACSCVSGASNVPTQTVTVIKTSILTPTVTVTLTSVRTSHTTIPTTTTISTSVTATTTVTETQTAVVDICDGPSYNPSGEGVGNAILTSRDCCELCQRTPDCVANAFPGSCQLLVKTVPLDGALTSPQCPLGIENYNFLPGPGVVFPGPCSSFEN